jgi:hypothetical protein
MSLCFNWLPRHEGVFESGGIAPRILDLSTRWRWSASRPSRFIPQGKIPWCPLDKRLGEPQSRSGRCGEGKNSQALSRLETPITQTVTQRYTAELSWFLLTLVYFSKRFVVGMWNTTRRLNNFFSGPRIEPVTTCIWNRSATPSTLMISESCLTSRFVQRKIATSRDPYLASF